jgi:hypothetical protein
MSTDRLPEETDRQWLAYCCYRDAPAPRTLAAAYCCYREKAGKGTGKQGQPSSAFSGWAKNFDWEGRARLWDLANEARQRERANAAADAEYDRQLKEYREKTLEAGRLGVYAALKLKVELNAYLRKKPAIESWSDALTVCRMIAAIEGPSFEMLAKALCLDELLRGLADLQPDRHYH